MKLQDLCIGCRICSWPGEMSLGVPLQPSSLQHLQGCCGSGQTWLSSAGPVVPVLFWGCTMPDHWALHEAIVCLHLSRQGQERRGQEAIQAADLCLPLP